MKIHGMMTVSCAVSACSVRRARRSARRIGGGQSRRRKTKANVNRNTERSVARRERRRSRIARNDRRMSGRSEQGIVENNQIYHMQANGGNPKFQPLSPSHWWFHYFLLRRPRSSPFLTCVCVQHIDDLLVDNVRHKYRRISSEHICFVTQQIITVIMLKEWAESDVKAPKR